MPTTKDTPDRRTARKNRSNEAKRERGLAQISGWVPVDRKADAKAILKRLENRENLPTVDALDEAEATRDAALKRAAEAEAASAAAAQKLEIAEDRARLAEERQAHAEARQGEAEKARDAAQKAALAQSEAVTRLETNNGHLQRTARKWHERARESERYRRASPLRRYFADFFLKELPDPRDGVAVVPAPNPAEGAVRPPPRRRPAQAPQTDGQAIPQERSDEDSA